MISHTLNELADKARQIEDLLPGSSPTYRRMYLQLEHDIEVALERIASSIVKKFNMSIPVTDKLLNPPEAYIDQDSYPGDSVAYSDAPEDADDYAPIGDTDDSSD